ncbi:hypothetical protein BJV78DRAFT_1198341 [Lactifluus subvellereus]|nr:hypothetical protein BJV78DRAFT_1198341 [Lactifluus subvellereus]
MLPVLHLHTHGYLRTTTPHCSPLQKTTPSGGDEEAPSNHSVSPPAAYSHGRHCQPRKSIRARTRRHA